MTCAKNWTCVARIIAQQFTHYAVATSPVKQQNMKLTLLHKGYFLENNRENVAKLADPWAGSTVCIFFSYQLVSKYKAHLPNYVVCKPQFYRGTTNCRCKRKLKVKAVDRISKFFFFKILLDINHIYISLLEFSWELIFCC